MEPHVFLEKKSNFSHHGFSRYLTPNMALQTIILTSFFFFFSFSSRSRAMRSSSHNFSKILSNRNEISQTCSGVNVVVPNTFWVHSVQGVRSWGTSKWKNFAMLFQAGFRNIWIFSWIILCWVEMDLRRLETLFFHGWNGRHAWLIPVVKLIFYDVIVMKERL